MDHCQEVSLQDLGILVNKEWGNPSKLQERQNSELFKKVETLEKDMKKMKEMLKGKFVNT